jgi:NAD-dependent SIR2 family protein deacetylase
MSYVKDKFEYFCNRIKEKYPNENLTVVEYTGSLNLGIIKCNKCGEVYTLKRAYNFLNPTKEKICKKCVPRKDTIELGNKVNYVLKNNKNIELLNSYTKITDDLELKCLKCGSVFKRKPQVFLKSQKCPLCETFSAFKTKEVFEQQLYNLYKDEYTLVGEYLGTNKKTLFKHNDCGFIFYNKPHNILLKAPCPKCKRFNSKGEIKINKILTENNIEFETQKHFSELGLLSFDFYIPQFNLLIEYQGEQHFMPIKHFGGEEKFKKQQDNDKIKRKFCEENKYSLLEIKYIQYNDIENILSFLWLND